MIHSAGVELSHLGRWLEVAVYIVIYALLRAIDLVVRTLYEWAGSVIERTVNICEVVGLRKSKYILPSHVALSCPFLSTNAVREEAIAAFVVQLFADGVLHVTLHDPATAVIVSRFLGALCATATLSSASVRHVNLFVTHIGPKCTQRSVISLPISVPFVEELCTKRSLTHRKVLSVDENCLSSVDDSDGLAVHEHDVCLRKDGSENRNDLQKEHSSGTPDISGQNVCFDVTLTIVSSQSPRVGLVRASQKLARSRDSKSSKMTVEDVFQWLDREPLVANLSSEPDVLVVFPAPNAPSVPILHNFPIWQLRLTMIIFANTNPHHMLYRSLVRMIASAAKKPKRFGR